LILAVAIAAAAAAVVVVLDPFARHGADRVKHLVDWSGGCVSVDVNTSPRDWAALLDFQKYWRSADARASIQCMNAGPLVGYARFPTEQALRHDVAAAPPLYRICDLPKLVNGHRRLDGSREDAAAFRRMCSRRGGRFSEETYRYCVAGREVVVDGLDEAGQFDDLCDDLDGREARPPAPVPR
jgi:hypothetical protein